MHHIEAFSAGPLFPVVKKYVINCSSPPHEYVHPVMPFDSVFFMFTLGEASKMVFNKYDMDVKTCMGIGGQVVREKIQVLCSGYVDFIFAELHPIALYYLYKSPLKTFTDNFTPLDDSEEINLKEKVLNTPGIYGKLEMVKSFLECNLPINSILKDNIFCLSQWVEQRGGQVSVAEMAHRMGIGVRQLERVFLEKMGISPKYYTKMVQMRQATNLLMTKGRKPLQDIVYQQGHYDAAHFNKDVRKFLNTNPKRFVREDAALFKRLLEEY